MKSSAKTPIRVPIRSAKSREQLLDRIQDPVQVFCRVRPLQSDSEESCVRIKSSTTVILTPPEIAVNYKLNAQKETQYIFKHVFDSNSIQREIYASVAEPLIENLIRGKNGLLFTYGVTGSGKTYTMTGNIHHHGIMPRCMDSLFKTISEYQTKKFVFKPDKLNGFEILSDADAMLERQAEMNSRFAKPRRKNSDLDEIASQASTDARILPGLDEDNMFAVFVTYVEIYNNSVYDLLEDGSMQRTLQSKIIREDGNHNMFVHGVTEIEIKSVEEAIDIFQTGQKRKRMGDTILNAESSRSHSVFTIRLVQAPTDSQGEAVLQDKHTILISQLSLVDLAGSERTNRTKNTGQRLREAGNINNSLMTLRTCLEYLRENQINGTNKKVPYRDSKLTHLFKNYFEGEGQVCMIVCINPRAEDYDETSQVMKFAEMTQEVQVARPTPLKLDIGLTPGRRKANKLFKTDIDNFNNYIQAKNSEMDLGIVYSLGPNFPDLKFDSPETNEMNLELIKYLEQRIQKRLQLAENLEARCNNFRMHLYQTEKENVELKTELALIKAGFKKERESKMASDNKIIIYESSIDELNRKLHKRDEVIKNFQKELAQKEFYLNQKELEKQKQKKKYTSKLAVEKDKIKSEFDIKMSQQRNRLEERMRVQDKKIRLVNDIMQADNVESLPSLVRSHSTEDIQKIQQQQQQRPPSTQAYSQTQTRHTPRTIRGVPVANVRHRRSKSAGDKWLEHRAANPVPLGTILQPYLKNRKSVTKLTDAKDLTNQKTSKYCLISQGADTDGEVETKLFKGNVIPTIGGGAQVVFDDVECLKQMSPVKSPQRKRPSNPTVLTEIPLEEITSRCNVSMEGHSSKRPKM